MSIIARKSVELASLYSSGELGFHAGYKALDPLLEENEKPSPRNIGRYVFPVVASGALVLATKIPVTASGRLYNALGSISGIAYPAVKNYGLEQQQLPKNKYREIANGTASGTATGFIDYAVRRFGPPLRPLGSIPPRVIPHTIGGGVAGGVLVLGSLLVDKCTQK
jgi:hypothetical protein